MGNLYVQLGNNERAIDLFKRVIALDPDNADACNQLGSVHKSDGNYAEASASYKRVLSLDPFKEDAHMELAELNIFNIVQSSMVLKKRKSGRGLITYWPSTRITERESNF